MIVLRLVRQKNKNAPLEYMGTRHFCLAFAPLLLASFTNYTNILCLLPSFVVLTCVHAPMRMGAPVAVVLWLVEWVTWMFEAKKRLSGAKRQQSAKRSAPPFIVVSSRRNCIKAAAQNATKMKARWALGTNSVSYSRPLIPLAAHAKQATHQSVPKRIGL